MRRYAEDNGGWTNYETRAVALWVNNDRGLYGYLQEVVEDMEQEFSGGNLVPAAICLLICLNTHSDKSISTRSPRTSWGTSATTYR